ncbi:MAG: YbbR-like domain-containing protein [Myxococcales bacterium]|nr:YbbR-like domain-containing protein [Myxococcales bacterium]
MTAADAPRAHGRVTRRHSSNAAAWLREAALDNFWLKLLSLVLALALYNAVHSTHNAQRTIQVPIVADMPPPNAARQLVSALPESVSVTLEGSRQQLDTLEIARLDPLSINLRDARDGEARITPEMLKGLPSGVRVTRIQPAALAIRWENVIALTLEVQVPVTGQLLPGMALKGVTSHDKSVTATGPESVVKGLQLLRTEPFDIGGLGEGSHTRSLSFATIPPRIELSETTCEATAEVTRQLVTRDFDVKVLVVGLPRARTQPAIVRVSVEATAARAGSLRPDSVIARVEPDAATLDLSRPGSALLPVSVDVADANVTISPVRVLVRW